MERLHRAQCGTVSSMSDDQRAERRPRGRVLRQVAQEEVTPFARLGEATYSLVRTLQPRALESSPGFSLRVPRFCAVRDRSPDPTRPLPEPAPTQGAVAATAATSSQHFRRHVSTLSRRFESPTNVDNRLTLGLSARTMVLSRETHDPRPISCTRHRQLMWRVRL